MTTKKPYWETKTLEQMTPKEWEDLCDRCGKCCLNKIDYEGNQHVIYTNVSCRLFDAATCACSNYSKRKHLVNDCIKLTPDMVKKNNDLPKTCAYRLIYNKQPLKSWHHLISGSKDTVYQQTDTIKNKVINEIKVDDEDLDRHTIKWIKPDSMIDS